MNSYRSVSGKLQYSDRIVTEEDGSKTPNMASSNKSLVNHYTSDTRMSSGVTEIKSARNLSSIRRGSEIPQLYHNKIRRRAISKKRKKSNVAQSLELPSSVSFAIKKSFRDKEDLRERVSSSGMDLFVTLQKAKLAKKDNLREAIRTALKKERPRISPHKLRHLSPTKCPQIEVIKDGSLVKLSLSDLYVLDVLFDIYLLVKKVLNVTQTQRLRKHIQLFFGDSCFVSSFYFDQKGGIRNITSKQGFTLPVLHWLDQEERNNGREIMNKLSEIILELVRTDAEMTKEKELQRNIPSMANLEIQHSPKKSRVHLHSIDIDFCLNNIRLCQVFSLDEIKTIFIFREYCNRLRSKFEHKKDLDNIILLRDLQKSNLKILDRYRKAKLLAPRGLIPLGKNLPQAPLRLHEEIGTPKPRLDRCDDRLEFLDPEILKKNTLLKSISRIIQLDKHK